MASFSASSQQQYKTYNRRRRTLYTDEPFGLGMQYVTNPLNTGAVKNLINIDLALENEALTPREGIRAFEITQSPISECDPYVSDHLKDKEILRATEITEENGEVYKQIILSEVHSNTTPIGNGKVTCLSNILTGLTSEESANNVVNVADESVETTLQNKSLNYNLHCTKPEISTIHDVPLENTDLLTELIGTTLTVDNSTRFYCLMRSLTGFQQDNVNYPVGDHLMFTEFDDANKVYKLTKLLPYQATANDATNGMYNMLLDDPYSFTNLSTSVMFTLMGLYPVDRVTGNAVPLYYTYKNNSYRLKLQYNCTLGEGQSKYLVRWSWSTGSSSNFDIVKEDIIDMETLSTLPDLYLDWTSNTTACIFRIEVFKWETYDQYNPTSREIESVTGFNTIACSVLPVMLTFADQLPDASKVLEYTSYDLTTAVGMCTWKQRLVMWGPEKATQAIFISEPNNPAWFPYPSGLCAFPDKVIKCVPYLDHLLVFTTTEIYLLTLDATGSSWTQASLQKNLHISESDATFIKSIRNMVFYKSNNYFYMIVPSSTTANGITVAPITTNIEYLLDHFSTVVESNLQDLYGKSLTVYKTLEYDSQKDYIRLVHFQNYVDYKCVYNVYTFKDLDNKYINYYLIYDTTTRTWTSYILESQSLIRPFRLDTSGYNVYASYVPVILYDDTDQVVSDSIQFLHRNPDRRDFYIYPYQTPERYGLERYKLEELCYTQNKYRNYQLIDTGAREQESDYKKRYRELQIQVNNVEQSPLTFYTTFSLDGYLRQDDFKYEVMEYLNPSSDRYGEIQYQRVYDVDAGSLIPGSTELGTLEYFSQTDEQYVDPLAWRLDKSQFPEVYYWKIRIPVSGKGYTPRLKIVTMDEVKYELLNLTWVYRMLYAR